MSAVQYAKPFVIGGSVVAGSKVVASTLGPSLAPLVGGIPTSIISSFFLKEENATIYISNLWLMGLMSVLVQVGIAQAKKKMPDTSIHKLAAAGLAVWFVLSYMLLNYVNSTKK